MTIPTWLNALAWAALISAGITAAVIVFDIARGRRQPMRIMEVVWPVTALYFGPFGWMLYHRLGRPPAPGEPRPTREKPYWQSVFVSATHCGAGCTLGDILADILIVVFGISIVPLTLGTSYILDFSAAYAFGILFQYLPIRAMGQSSPPAALWAAVKADTLSLVAFEIGLFGWMALVQLVWFPGLKANTALFWFMMQIGMVIGFATTYPMNWWLVKAGIKHGM
ncbi:MAG: DUF4396 domain-containing protein [Gammaproteobacteria bacterium]